MCITMHDAHALKPARRPDTGTASRPRPSHAQITRLCRPRMTAPGNTGPRHNGGSVRARRDKHGSRSVSHLGACSPIYRRLCAIRRWRACRAQAVQNCQFGTGPAATVTMSTGPNPCGKETADPMRSGGERGGCPSPGPRPAGWPRVRPAGLWGARRSERWSSSGAKKLTHSPRYSAARPDAGGSSWPCWRAMPAAGPGRYQRPWTTVPLCSVTTFLALPVQSMKAGRSCQVSRASLQCSTTPAGDS
jgi:hypothetical protein